MRQNPGCSLSFCMLTAGGIERPQKKAWLDLPAGSIGKISYGPSMELFGRHDVKNSSRGDECAYSTGDERRVHEAILTLMAQRGRFHRYSAHQTRVNYRTDQLCICLLTDRNVAQLQLAHSHSELRVSTRRPRNDWLCASWPNHRQVTRGSAYVIQRPIPSCFGKTPSHRIDVIVRRRGCMQCKGGAGGKHANAQFVPSQESEIHSILGLASQLQSETCLFFGPSSCSLQIPGRHSFQ